MAHSTSPASSHASRRPTRVPRRWRQGVGIGTLPRSRKGRASVATHARRVLWSWWPWSLISLAAIIDDRWGWAIGAALVAFVCYLLAPTEAPPVFGLDHEFAADSESFPATLTGATGAGFISGNQVTILNNGDEFYPAMLAAIRAATRSVTIEAYIYWAGEIGLTFANALADKARTGVPIKILLDAVGSSSIGSDILQVLQEGGCQVAWHNPVHWYTIHRYNHRTHRKSLVVDGTVGFTGGAGIADQWRGHAQSPEHWRDVQVRLEGPAVMPLQTGFAQNWLQNTGELVSGPDYFPSVPPAGAVAVQTVMSSPVTGSSTVRLLHYLAIVCARRSIAIANPYFIPDAAATEILIDARKRGVHVRVLVSGIRNDNWLARHNSIGLYGPLLRAGIEIVEYNRTMLHQKLMIVDGVWATIGTTNFDWRSFAHNEETSVSMIDRGLVSQLTHDFDIDVSAATPVTLHDWHRRGVVQRSRELVAAFLREQV
jgi:cardiolipin synthase A/B